jgi:hypothetical protein
MDGRFLPSPKSLSDMFSLLVGRDVAVRQINRRPLDLGDTLGVYVDDRLRMTAVAVLDLPFACYFGAALGLVPPGQANAAVKDGLLPVPLKENTAEVLNVLAAVLNVDGSPHQRLYSVHAPGERRPSDAAAVAVSQALRLDVSVAVKGYGSGRLAIIGPLFIDRHLAVSGC